MKTIRFLVIGVFVATACACSCSGDEAAAPTGSTEATPAAAPAESSRRRRHPRLPEIAPLAPDLAAHLVRFHSPVIGRADAPVTIVEVLDPACEACSAFAPLVKQILFVHPNEVRVVVRYAAFHAGSEEAIRVLDAARRQGKFDETLTALFDRQEEWAAHAAPNAAQAWQIAADSEWILQRRARMLAAPLSMGCCARSPRTSWPSRWTARRHSSSMADPPSLSPQQLLELVDSEVRRAQESRPQAR